MAQQTFSGVPGAFTPGEVLSSADQNLLRDFLVAQVKEGQTGDTGEILPMIMDLTNNRIVLDSGGLEFSDGSTQTAAASAVGFSGTTANGLLTYNSASTITTQSTATYASNTLTLTGAGGGLKLDGLNSSNVNTLDDYEEGYWTCALSASTSGTITVDTGSDQGAYTKVGRVVHIQGLFTVSAISSPSGTLRVGGLPFTVAPSLNESADRGSNCGTVVNLANVKYGIITHVHANTTFMDMNAGGGGTAEDGLLADDVDTGSYFLISGSYIASA